MIVSVISTRCTNSHHFNRMNEPTNGMHQCAWVREWVSVCVCVRDHTTRMCMVIYCVSTHTLNAFHTKPVCGWIDTALVLVFTLICSHTLVFQSVSYFFFFFIRFHVSSKFLMWSRIFSFSIDSLVFRIGNIKSHFLPCLCNFSDKISHM